jgi:hypothetical protein
MELRETSVSWRDGVLDWVIVRVYVYFQVYIIFSYDNN